ncbi:MULTISPECIES: DUF4226 domain-containing protein [Mycobacterium simiae complex]|nr:MULTISPECIES: DUF4226 domain-containing protein [Mycobacterium simiae complex]ULP45432.1 DUF4226 domain-containing protein [Mycobacterium lentiflavum]
MTGWADVALSQVLGGVSEVLGAPFPQNPVPGGPVPLDPAPTAPFTSRDELTKLDRARLTYMGINPDTAPMPEINKALGRDQPASPPPPAPPPGSPGPTTPAGTPPPPGLSGAGAEAAKRLDEALAKNHSALNDADDKLADAVLKASSSSTEGRQRLQSLQQDIIDQVNKLGSSLDTATGQQQLAEFLQGKTGDILNVLKNAGLDSDSQARVLDGLSARYQALQNKNSGEDPHTTGPDANPGATNPTAGGGGDTPAGTGDGTSSGNDPLLDGLASDPLMSRLGMMAGPAMGALGSLPGALGSAIPSLGGGGGLGGGGLGDLGSALGGALRDGGHDPDQAAEEHANALKDPSDSHSDDKSHDETQPAGLHDPGDKGGKGDKAGTEDAGSGATPPPSAPAAQGQTPTPTTQIQLPDQSVRTASNAALAQAGRAVLSGDGIDDAFAGANLQLPPLGSPVNAPMAPSRLQFGDVGQYTDHRVMALDKDHVWLNGQVTPIDQLETGPNFLGWTRVSAPTPTTVAAAATAPAPSTT